MIDNVNKPVEGFFSLKIYDKDDKLIDEVYQKNKIMKPSKLTMAKQIAGKNVGGVGTATDGVIGSFTLGTKGHQETNILQPKDFNFDRDYLFSQDRPTDLDPTPGDIWMVDFAANTDANPALNNAGYFTYATNVWTPGAQEVPIIDIQVDDSSSTITYTYELGLDVGNGAGAAVYTEASMCTNKDKDYNNALSGDIFSMRTFSGKIKDNTVRFVITWKIAF